MPPLSGETCLLTLFADVHYFFATPSSRPLHDRFDKGSYAYLFHNPTQGKLRLEIANAAGTPEQDAFNGYLDSVLLRHKYRQPNLLSVIADAIPVHPPPAHSDQSQWRLPAYDWRHEQKYLRKVHAVDLYFWTATDALRVLELSQRLLPKHQLDLIKPPPANEHRDSMSPVVEKLEQAAIESPPQERTPSALSAQAAHATALLQPAQMAPAPAPYNPAAPAAPEPIAHREKTPPPEDADSGTGLAGVASNEQGVTSVPTPALSHHLSYQRTPQQQQFFPGPPQRSASMQSLPPPPPPPSNPNEVNASVSYQHNQRSSSLSPLPNLPLSPPAGHSNAQGQAYQTQYAGYALYQGYPASQAAGGIQSPDLPSALSAPPSYGQSAPLNSPSMSYGGLQSPGFPLHSSSPPVGGYSNYNYNQQPHQSHGQADAYNVHGQLYKPTESEAAHGHEQKPPKNGPVRPGGFEDRVGKLEKGVGRFLRKLDNKI